MRVAVQRCVDLICGKERWEMEDGLDVVGHVR